MFINSRYCQLIKQSVSYNSPNSLFVCPNLDHFCRHIVQSEEGSKRIKFIWSEQDETIWLNLYFATYPNLLGKSMCLFIQKWRQLYQALNVNTRYGKLNGGWGVSMFVSAIALW